MTRRVRPFQSLRLKRRQKVAYIRRRKKHLNQLAMAMRHKLAAAYPDGVDPRQASRWLNDGDQIVAALKRFEDGSYGNCYHCHQSITLLQLWARPHRLLCRTCEIEQGWIPPRHFRHVY